MGKTMTTAYVYKWTHLPTLKWYVGSRTRKGCHPDDGYICSSTIKKMILKQPNDWIREIIAIGDPIEMYIFESEILQLFDAKNDMRCFNNHNNNFEWPGLPNTEKSKMKTSMALKNHTVTEKTRKRISETQTGRKHSLEEIEKRRLSMIGHSVSEETRKKISEANKGKKHTDEFKNNISIRMTGKIQSNETKEKRRQAMLGRVFSEESKLKMSKAAKKRKLREKV
jgi:hypothetical protein